MENLVSIAVGDRPGMTQELCFSNWARADRKVCWVSPRRARHTNRYMLQHQKLGVEVGEVFPS